MLDWNKKKSLELLLPVINKINSRPGITTMKKQLALDIK
jgi:hypothetical protein